MTPRAGPIDVMGRLPDGRFQVTTGGRDFALPPSQAAQVAGMSLPDFEAKMAQATQSSLTGPRAADGSASSRPPIWQGRARYGHQAQVLSRNPDGTFQVTVDGAERTMTEPNVAFMTGLKKGPLYEMLGKATDGWMRGESGEISAPPSKIENSVEASSFYQADRIAPPKTVADRAYENRRLLDGRPQRCKAPSESMHLLSSDAHGLAIQKAMILVDYAHDDGDLTPVRLNHRVDHVGAEGAYRWAQGKIWAQIGIRRETAYPLITTIHEIGHHIRLHLDPDDVAELATVARRSNAANLCREIGMPTDYWLSDSELFSRCYAQWVAQKSVDPEVRVELQSILDGSDKWQQFNSEDWIHIEKAMDHLMKKKGWL